VHTLRIHKGGGTPNNDRQGEETSERPSGPSGKGQSVGKSKVLSESKGGFTERLPKTFFEKGGVPFLSTKGGDLQARSDEGGGGRDIVLPPIGGSLKRKKMCTL